jgi:plastocyanin
MGVSKRSGYRSLLLTASVLVALVMLTAAAASGCGSGATPGSSSSSSLTTMTTIPANSTVVTQASGANAQGPGAKIVLKDGTVSPTELQVPVGTGVTFQDMDDDTTRTYHLVSTDGSFDTGVLSEGGSYVITFQKAGTLEYQDKDDPNIKGKIIIE